MKKLFFYLLVFCSLVFFISCTAVTTLLDNSTNKDFKVRKLNKVAIFMNSNKNKSALETVIISELKNNGINVFRANEILSEDLLEPPKDLVHYKWIAEKIKLRLDNLGIDAVLFSYMAGEKEIIGTSAVLLPNNFYNTWSSFSRIFYTPQYSRKVYFITNLCDVATGDIIWSATSETINPYSVSELGESYTSAIIDEFRDEGFVK